MNLKLLEKEKETIYKYFPSYRPVWNQIVGKVPTKVKNEELYTYYAYVCVRDFADRYQFAWTAFFESLREFFLHRRLQLSEHPRISSVFYFRYHFDYAILSLFSALNHLLSSYFYFYGKQNEIEIRTRTIGEIIHPKNANKFPFELKQFAEKYSLDRRYQIIEGYRHTWTHQGIPKIEGEYRPKRNNPIAKHGFAKNILGLVQTKEGYAMVDWSDDADYTVHKLVSSASWLYQIMGEEAVLHYEQVKKSLNFTLNLEDLFGRN